MPTSTGCILSQRVCVPVLSRGLGKRLPPEGHFERGHRVGNKKRQYMRTFVQAKQRPPGQDHRIGDANAGRYASGRLFGCQRNFVERLRHQKQNATKTLGCGRQLYRKRSNSHEDHQVLHQSTVV